GGEEFIVFGECDDRQQVIDLCENFRLSIETQSDASIDVAFTVSQGITFSAKALNEAISIADQHLYQAKQRGRNLVVY
ncbi:MAG: diguanylate cyclase, partial [Hydrogenovibrio sp.]|nr:diguanylate cyclase [Hydrogenovibrio sp.]